MGPPRWLSGKESAFQCRKREMQVASLGQEDPLEEETATHSSILAWETLWTEEPGSIQFMGLQRVGYALVTEHGPRPFTHGAVSAGPPFCPCTTQL